MIPESFVQDLLARVDVADVVGRYVQLRKGGANLLGLCPFHNEKTPSFTVSPTKQFYHCFGCGAHGSAISFLIEHTGASFPEAVRSLAASVGMIVPEAPRSPAEQAASKRRKQEVSRHEQLLAQAQSHYQAQLKASPVAVRYLKQRGLTGATAARFGLGWTGADRRGLAGVFEHYEDPLLVESGLVVEAEDGRRYDRFRERIMFPIHSSRGKLIGFGGRLIAKGEPKYLNSPETPLFTKGQELYGLWEGRQGIRAEGCVLVVEGYMDVVGLAEHGLYNAVGTMGTATTPEHIQKLLRASDKIVFSFDGDNAGRKAAWRALQTCLPLLRDDASIRFLFLPHEHDPDSYAKAFGVEAFRAMMAEATPLSRFMLDELASRHVLAEAEGRAACVHEAKPLLALMPQGTLRIQIERDFAKLVQLTPEELAQMMAAVPHARQPSVEAHLPVGDDRGFTQYEPEGFMDDIPPVYEVDAGWSEPRQGHSRPSQAASVAGGLRSRAVTPMAKRLLRLLLAHPELVDSMADQQLEILEHGPHLVLVKELIALAHASGARHAGALQQAADPASELGVLLQSLSTEILLQDDLPDPVAEWNDALHRIELDSIKAEQSELIAAGLKDPSSRERYQTLTRRLALLNSDTSR